jgi:hypothetical protein
MSLLAAALLFGGYSPSTLKDLYLLAVLVAGACAVIVAAGWIGQRR